jgi:subtilisin family serine protease
MLDGMWWRLRGRFPVLVAAALVAGLLAVPAGTSAADTAHRIIAESSSDGPTVDLLIGARPGRGKNVTALAAGFGRRDKGAVRGLSVHRLRVPAEAASALEQTFAADPSVGYVEVDAAVRAMVIPNDPFYGPAEWGLPLIGAPAAWDTSTGTDGPIIAVVDTGVDAAHPDFDGRVLPGIDLVNGDDDADDDNGHGTHVAGIIAATGNNGIGGAGVCWGCRILPVKALDATGTGAYSTLAAGITWAADHGAQVINLSLGGAQDSITLRAAVAYAQDHGAVVVAAAGNSGTSTPFYPASFDGVIAVGAEKADTGRYDFSDYGPSWVDVAAPGCSESTFPDAAYASMCGTSMATPFVSGSIGLLLVADAAATPADAATALEATAGPDATAWTEFGAIHLDLALASLLDLGTPYPAPVRPMPPSPVPDPPAPTPKPAPTPIMTTHSVSLSVLPKSVSVSAVAGSGRISLSNPRHAYLVLTLRRGKTVVWRAATRSGVVRWAFKLRAAVYTLTVSRSGSHSAKGTVAFTYHHR